MSHSVTVTRTTTTSQTSAILLNIGYLKKPPGILKLIHIILGVITVGLLGHNIGLVRANYNYPSLISAELFFLLIATTCLITSTLLLLSCFISIATATILPKTIFELLYHGAAAILLIIGAAVYCSRLHDYQSHYYINHTQRLIASELVYFSPLSFLLLVSAFNCLGTVISRNSLYSNSDLLYEPGYGAKIFASILGIVNGILYGVAAFFSWRNYKSG